MDNKGQKAYLERGILVFPENFGLSEEDCPGHTAMDDNPKICRYCGTHVDSLHDRDDNGEDGSV